MLLPDGVEGMGTMPPRLAAPGDDDGFTAPHAADFFLQYTQFRRVDQVVFEVSPRTALFQGELPEPVR